MAIFKCDSCGYERDVPDKLTGKKAKCPDCGHGVTIFDTLTQEEEVDESSSGDQDEFLDGRESAQEQSTDELNLDSADITVDLSDDADDIICDNCGEVVDRHATVCPKCSNPISQSDEFPELTEDHVDVSDLADSTEPQIWEAEFSGNGEETASLDDEDDDGPKWNFFEGNIALNIFAGLVSGLLGFFFAVAMAVLISAQQDMHEFLPYVLATSLTGMTVGSIFFSLQTRIPFALSGTGLGMSAVLSLLVGSICRTMVGTASPEVIIATVIGAIVVSTFVTGFTLWLIGKLNAGRLVSYIPIQIIGGVIGAIGVFVIVGTLDWIGPLSMDWTNVAVGVYKSLPDMDGMHSMWTMGPGVVFGFILFGGLSRYKNSLFLLGLLLVASAVGHVAWMWWDDELLKSLAAPIPHLENGLPVFAVQLLKEGLGDIRWDVILANNLYIGALAMFMVLSTMYRVTRLELLQGRESDLNREYRVLGLTNILSGLCGGTPVVISYGRSAGNHATGGRGPVAGVVAGLVCGAGLFFINHIIFLVPRFVPEGLLIFSGLAFIASWMFRTRTAFTRRDDLWMLWITFFMSIGFGLLVGVGFGVALALMVTVARSSKGGSVRNVLSGANHRSNVDRAPAQLRTLKEYGDHILILRLQGFLFLGSMSSLLKKIQDRLEARNMLSVEYLILDFKMVTGLASAAGVGFDKLRKLTEEHEVQVIITSAPLELEEHLEESGYLGAEAGAFKVFFNLDYAMEWCENHVLDSENMLEMKQMTLAELLAPVFPEPKYIPALMKVMKRVDVKKGEAVFRQGDSSDSMYFVESGKLDVELELEGGKLLRLKKVGPGAVFGEMGIYTLAPRSATIRAAEKCVLYMMTTNKLNAVEKRAPMLVTTIHRFMINMLADRLNDANFKVRDLMD
ncbi:SulP family inorganic anion transporter [Pseudodesulfovibrio sp. zrk46]|uniref:SulP family inorganic anion transporter n=1 Tax=Pseudodesulfovibrio sp. zrk46 TaxID=2725288 RepID=UPI0014493944|nr:SulP family inorganic anion transporter [Pseudodesulfovibrio sp. zrk46]QJB57992.1 cyclic nucleotide-binding domain-containing protein [Pseudodesulfovibrio sp. zrk46]